MQGDVIPVVQIRSDRVVCYNEYQYHATRRGKNNISLNNLQAKKYKGCLSKESKKKLERAIVQWSDSISNISRQNLKDMSKSKSRLIMLTITLSASQEHSDEYIKRNMLNRLLITMKRKYGCENYIWKAEFQQNDNIHFHIILDKFIPAMDIRGIWNSIQASHGYIDRFESKSGHRNPNSTDIHQIRDLNRSLIYMRKYMSKIECSRIEGGKAWGCSDNLLALRPVVVHHDNQVNQFINYMECNGVYKVINKDNCKIIFGDIKAAMSKTNYQLFTDWKDALTIAWTWSNSSRIEKVVSEAMAVLEPIESEIRPKELEFIQLDFNEILRKRFIEKIWS